MYVKFIEDKKFVLFSSLSFINLERNFHKMKNYENSLPIRSFPLPFGNISRLDFPRNLYLDRPYLARFRGGYLSLRALSGWWTGRERRQKPSAPSWYVKNDAQPQSPDTSPPRECPEGSVPPRRLSGPRAERRVTGEVALFETINWVTVLVKKKNNPRDIYIYFNTLEDLSREYRSRKFP